MAQRVQLLSKLSPIVCFMLAACHTTHEKSILNEAMVGSMETRGGMTSVNGTLYSGTLFYLYPGTRDTQYTRNYLDGLEHGTWKLFYPNGRLAETRYFKRGKKEGEYLAYWENGTKKLEYHFKDGEYEGSCREWNINGTLCKEMNYKKGYEEGPQKVWYDNGSVKSNYIIRNGRRYGLLGTMNCKNVSDSVFNP